MTTVSDAELDELVSRMDGATKAYINGDVRRYMELFDHADDYTLMPPYGGETSHGFSPTDEEIEATSKFFVSGHATFEVEQRYASGDLAVLVAVEAQRGHVGDFPEQDWSLRVTIVFRRVGDRWQVVHRHADPLVRAIPLDHCAELARGLGTD
jgi:ketosteroid isomerase-like protein